MSDQLTFARVRRTDGPGSHEAADELERSGRAASQHRRVLATVRSYPGLTSRQLSAADGGLDRYAYARRLPELERRGLVKRQQAKAGQARWFPLEEKAS